MDTENPTPPPPREVINDPARIRAKLLKALREEELVEVEINGRTRLFYTHFMDHPPPPVEMIRESRDADGEPVEEVVLKELPYEPFAYLKDANHLAITPLVPPVGNVQIRTSQEIILRFFEGVLALEAQVAFLGVAQIREEPAITLTFPTELHLMRKRRHFRAPVMPQAEISLSLHRPGKEALFPKLLDISSGGLSICSPIGPEELPLGSALTLVLERAEEQKVRLGGFVRNHVKTTPKMGCAAGMTRMGIQLDIPSQDVAQRVDEITALAQRVRMQQVREQRGQESREHHPQATPEKQGMGQVMGRFMQQKGSYRFR